MTETHTVTAKIWLWTTDKAPASWHFVTIEGEVAEAIHALALMRRLENGRKRGWGTINVRATIGETEWESSIFPAKDVGGWLLPIKAAVRKAEGLSVGDEIAVTVRL
jgi:hypothetical protein